MRFPRFSAAVMLSLVLCGTLILVHDSAGGRASVQEGSPRLEDLAWLEGSWRGEAMGGLCEEHWSSPRGGTMMGMFRLVKESKTSVTEYLLIEESQEGITYRFKHISKDWKPWEKEALFFRLKEAKGTRAVFECPAPQRPKRLEYVREKDSLVVKVTSIPDDGGEADSFEVPMKRVKRERDD